MKNIEIFREIEFINRHLTNIERCEVVAEKIKYGADEYKRNPIPENLLSMLQGTITEDCIFEIYDLFKDVVLSKLSLQKKELEEKLEKYEITKKE